MKVPRVKHKVKIICTDGSFVTGFVHVAEGLRVLDFFNDQQLNFIAVTDATFQNLREVHSFKLVNDMYRKKETIFLNRESIKWVEEI
ncbi:MAG: hypothetical protein PHV55_00485 [Candidatus Omnitrophica bacterium]|nr:hypothetical protein [Candidatus Omnitrophota bacterium]